MKKLFFVVRLDGKSYDAFLMCYKSDTDAGLNDDDRKWLESVMEEEFSYSLCLFDRDVLPGKGTCLDVLQGNFNWLFYCHDLILIPLSK